MVFDGFAICTGFCVPRAASSRDDAAVTIVYPKTGTPSPTPEPRFKEWDRRRAPFSRLVDTPPPAPRSPQHVTLTVEEQPGPLGKVLLRTRGRKPSAKAIAHSWSAVRFQCFQCKLSFRIYFYNNAMYGTTRKEINRNETYLFISIFGGSPPCSSCVVYSIPPSFFTPSILSAVSTSGSLPRLDAISLLASEAIRG